ncbi:MAG: SDR family oxidoreductase [Planctomycetota bacterium]
MLVDLKGKTAVVCGSTQGIGYAAAQGLAAAGATVVLIARNRDRLADVCQQLPADDQSHRFLVADFSDPQNLQEVVSADVADAGPAHILINNTGGPPGGNIFDAELEAFENAFTQHLKCNHVLAQTLVPGMKTAAFGRIINVISTSVKQPLDGLGVSNTIRGAVANWAKTMSNELASFGITVNNVLPGATATQRLHSILENKAKKSGATIDEVAAKVKSAIPADRFAEAEEVANAIVFLASRQASYITGINLPVDGGRTKCL